MAIEPAGKCGRWPPILPRVKSKSEVESPLAKSQTRPSTPPLVSSSQTDSLLSSDCQVQVRSRKESRRLLASEPVES
ncbi:Hypothetical protein NTJ_09114 [Nesidiocoris tenuis]|uniref:Uncharacterized protein n=1 Tax=Nesidiocoris tenuis TaxID=355587 RepID=A0ABN7AVV5_9HEMI|nr:Hypothetical protein NTJ_09114 [Nesidiocoris tenuis]